MSYNICRTGFPVKYIITAARPADARVLALSFNGTISSDIPLTMKDRFGPRFAEATLGRGEPVISIDVVNGNISIRVPPGR